LRRRTEIWNDRGDRSARCARDRQSRRTNERFDRAHLQKATIIQWSDNATIFDALVEGKADLMITDAVETRVQAKLHPGVLCPVHPNAPFDHSELAYWMPRDPIFAACVING
jgi:cyclohexadienyl dehydratase